MIGRVHGRRAFEQLHRSRNRVEVGRLWIIFNPNGTNLARLAFAVPRAAGTAVERNRAKRRIRAAVAALVVQDASLLPPGDYLIRVGTGSFTFAEAIAWLSQGLDELAGRSRA